MQYLTNNLEDAKEEIIYKDVNEARINQLRGQIQMCDDILGMCDTLDKLKVASEEDKKRLQSIYNQVEPFQAEVEGKTRR